MKAKIILTILVLTILNSCTSERGKELSPLELNISNDIIDIKASDFFSQPIVIQLETTDRSLISEIVKIELFEELLIIQDKSYMGLFIFNKQGKLIDRFFMQGKGPSEYNSIDDFLIDIEKKTVEILDRAGSKIMIYDAINFNFIESIKIPFSFCNKFSKDDKGYYFQTNGSINTLKGNTTNSDIIFLDGRSYSATPVFKNYSDNNSNQWIEFPNIFFSDNQHNVFASLLWDNNIYRINKGLAKVFLTIINNNESFPSDIKTASYEEKLKFLNSLSNSDIKFGFRLIMYEDQNFILTYQQGNTIPKPYYFFSLNGGESVFSTNNIINDLAYNSDFPKIEIFSFNNGHFLSILYPSLIPNAGTSSHTSSLRLFDNPIVLIYTLKST